MRQFLTNNDVAFHDLEERARWACIRFRGQEMPPGCIPNHADIGFEVSETPPDTGAPILPCASGSGRELSSSRISPPCGHGFLVH